VTAVAPVRPAARRRPGPSDVAEALSPSVRLARRLAQEAHRDQLDEHGAPLFDVVERVALDVPESARRTAYLHRICTSGGTRPAQLAALLDLDEEERDALRLLVRRSGEDVLHVVRRIVASNEGPCRELALVVLRAALIGGHAADADERRRHETALQMIFDAWTHRTAGGRLRLP